MSLPDRPVTQHGLSGMKTAGLGPRRQVHDRSYYLQLLLAKCAEIGAEISLLHTRAEQSDKDHDTHAQLERKHERLADETRTLQGRLADHNLLLDRSRARKGASEVFAEYEELSAANAEERRRVDALFDQRTALDAQAREEEQQLHADQLAIARRVGDAADPQTKAGVFRLQEEERRLLLDELPNRSSELNSLTECRAEMEQAVARNERRSQMAQLTREIGHLEGGLQERRDEISNALEAPQLFEAQQREVLLKKIEADSAQICELERSLAQTRETVRSRRQRLACVDGSSTGESSDPEASEFEELCQREHEMNELMRTVSEQRVAEARETKQTQAEIVRLLESVSRKAERVSDQVNASAPHLEGDLDEVRADLGFKQVHQGPSATTEARLEHDLDQRKRELEKLAGLDGKTSAELDHLNQRLQSMPAELERFSDLKALKEESAMARQRLFDRKQEACEHRVAAQARASQQKKDYDKVCAQVAADATAVALDEMEQKMSHYKQTILVLSEYIETKGRETSWRPVAEQCMQLLGEVNGEVCSMLAEQPVFNTASLIPGDPFQVVAY